MLLKRAFIGIMVLSVLLVFASPLMAQDATTIRYAFWGNPTSIGVEQDIIDAFHAAHPEIRVVPVAVGYDDYHANLLTQIAGGIAPDVMRVDSYFFADFLKAGALLDITDLIERDGLDMDLYYQAGLADSMAGDRYYGFPWGVAPIYMLLNVDMFAEAGIPIPDADWTWDDLVSIIRTMAKGEGTRRQYALGIEPNMTYLFPFIWAAGADVFDETRTKFTLNDPRAVEVLDTLAGLVREDLLPDPANFHTISVLNRWMINNAIAMQRGTAHEVLTLQQTEDLHFIAMPMPGSAAERNTTVYKSNTVSIAASSRNQEAAWTFLKFLRGPSLEGENLYMAANRMPPSFSIPELWEIFADPTKHPKNLVDMSLLIADEYARLLPLRSGWNEIMGIIDPEIERIFSGQVSAQEAMDRIAPIVQEVMDRTGQ